MFVQVQHDANVINVLPVPCDKQHNVTSDVQPQRPPNGDAMSLQPARRTGDGSSQSERRVGDGSSAQPMITLTDMSDGRAGLHRRDQILYSDDFDAIQDYLLNTESPMLTMSPSWLCTDHSAMSVFPPAVNHSMKHVAGVTSTVNIVTCTQPAAMPSRSSTIDMSCSIGSSSALHDHKVCVCARLCSCFNLCFADLISMFYM